MPAIDDAELVLPVVAARTLKVSAEGLRWLANEGAIRCLRTVGDPSIRLYTVADVLTLLETRGRASVFRMLPARADRMARAELRQGLLALRRER